MARPRKPWYRKSNKRWYVEINGKQVDLGQKKKQACQRFHELMAQPQIQPIPRTSKILLIELADHFLEWVQRNRAEDTYEWYRYRLERFCHLHRTMVADQIRPYHVEEWVNKYDLSITSRRNYMRSVKRCLKWGKRQRYIDENPISDMEVPSGESKEVYIQPGEYTALLDYVRNQNFRDLIEVTWLCGCRPQESLIVEARHVDVKKQRWVFAKSESKGKRKNRVVYLPDNAMAIVQRLMHTNPEGTLFQNTAGKAWTTDAVNCAFDAVQFRMGKDAMEKRGIEISQKDISKFIVQLKPTRVSKGKEVNKTESELRMEAKRKLIQVKVKELVPRYSLYSLRHSFATNALQKGIDSLTVAILMGHQDPSTLAKVYQHLNQNPTHLLEQATKAVA